MFGKRPDATLATDVPPYRRIMPIIMRTRNESVVYFEQHVDVTKTLDFIDRWNEASPERRITPFHVVIWAGVRVLHERPALNRFVAAGSLWQRNGIWVSYAVKKRMDDDAPLATMKRRFEPGQSFAECVDAVLDVNRAGRSDEETASDKEVNFFLKLPVPVLRVGVRVIRRLSEWGMLPKSFVDDDPMYTSAFLANMGSLKMDAPFHHLYEYGNCPIFGVVGRVHPQVTVEDGVITSRPVVQLRWSYDERIADGLYAEKSMQILRRYVEDPEEAGAEIPAAAPQDRTEADVL